MATAHNIVYMHIGVLWQMSQEMATGNLIQIAAPLYQRTGIYRNSILTVGLISLLGNQRISDNPMHPNKAQYKEHQ